jgi:hypothetical protein
MVEVSPLLSLLVEIFVSGGGFANSIKEYLHRFYADFEHKKRCGRGSGDGGGFYYC